MAIGDDVQALPSPNTPAWVNNLALEVDSENELVTAKKRLEEAGVEVLGITNHHFIHSIYFFDPNGIRLELTVRTIENAELERLGSNAHKQLAAWNAEKVAVRTQARATKTQGALA